MTGKCGRCRKDKRVVPVKLDGGRIEYWCPGCVALYPEKTA